MTIKEAKALALTPQSFWHLDGWIIFNGAGQPVQSDFNEAEARRNVDVCNDHERRNGRPADYYCEPVSEGS